MLGVPTSKEAYVLPENRPVAGTPRILDSPKELPKRPRAKLERNHQERPPMQAWKFLFLHLDVHEKGPEKHPQPIL